MKDSARIPGLWWMSDDPDNTVPGDLLVDAGKLELNGSFEGIKPGPIGGLTPGLRTARQDKTILGIARNGGKKYTLEFFDEPSFTMSMPGYKADTYYLGNIFEGGHFDKTEQLSFERYYVEFPYLLEWVNNGIISVQTVFENSKPLKLKDTTVTIEAPKAILAYKKDDLEISFAFSRGSIPISPPLKDVHITQQCSVKLKSKSGIEFSDAWATIVHISRLLGIAIGKRIKPIRFQMSSGHGTKSHTITLLNVSDNTIERGRSLHVAEMNFSFNDIKADSQVLFDKWLSNRDKHADMFDLFSSIQSDRSRTINNQFLEIVSAIEGYVRVETSKLGMDLDKTIKILNEYLPKSDRLLKKADYDKIRITRNKLSHIALEKPGDEANVMDDNEKLKAIHDLTVLLEYGLLKNLGVSDTTLAAFYKKRKLRH